ncbi:4355_t:CDS:10, partial [Acaulospora colombiana]
EKELINERSRERESHEKDLEKLRKEKKDVEKQQDQKLNELSEKLSTAEQQILDLNMTIQERDADLQYVRQQLGNQTNRAKDAADRYVKEQERLRVELDTMRQETENLRSQLEVIGDELENKKTQIMEYENEVKHLNNLRTKLNEKLSASEAARSKSEEVFRNLQMDVRDKNSTIDELKAQVAHLENNLTQEKKSTYSNETQYRDQIIERNTLLMTTFQYLDTIMSDGTSKQSTHPKPSSNFAKFHEHLLAKLKTLSHVYNTFDRRAKEIDNRWQEQYESLKSQMDIKLRLLSKFEGMVQKASTAQKDWREQAKKNQLELEAARNTNEELIEQLSTLREQLDELRTVSVRAEELENKLKESDKRTRTFESQMKDDERKYDSRLKDLEFKVRQAEERLKVEKQGAKEKVESLIENIKDLETQLQAQNRRNVQLQELISIQKASMEATNESKVIAAKAENTFSMLNEQLREQLEEKNKSIDNERQRVKNLEEQFASLMEEHKRLCVTIEKREALLNKALSGLQMINQRKDLVENTVFQNLREVTEEVRSTLLDGEGHRRSTYQPPPYINPPWKPAGNYPTVNKKTVASKVPSPKTTSIPTYSPSSKIKPVSNTKSGIPTRAPSSEKTNSASASSNNGTTNQRGASPKEAK